MKITEITPEQIETLKQNSFVCLMYWAEGCGFCEQAKPEYKKIAEDFTFVNFYSIKMDEESYKFYSRYIPKEQVKIQSKHDDGEPILDADGNPLFTYKKDEDGKILEESPVSIPNFLVFHEKSADNYDEYGFLGNVEGIQMDRLRSILTGIKQQLDEEMNEQA